MIRPMETAERTPTGRNETASVLGAGASGLMASLDLVRRGYRVTAYDHRPEPALKFRLAGSSGLNLTNAADPERFASRYGSASSRLSPLLAAAGARELTAWAESLGVGCRTGSGGKVFTSDGDGSRLIEALLAELRASGRWEFNSLWEFSGFSAEGKVTVRGPRGQSRVLPPPVLLALGGASWPATGSDGAWTEAFRREGIGIAGLESANCGLDLYPPPEAGVRTFVKNVAVGYEGRFVRGDVMLTPTGIEGSPVYVHSSRIARTLRDLGGSASPDALPVLEADLFPDLSSDRILQRMKRDRGKASASTFLKKALGFDSARLALARCGLGREAAALILADPGLAKAIPLRCLAPRPIEEAISSSGGVLFEELDESLMLKRMPGVFCCGEMIDWDAPTGGFLLTGCFATACRAARGMEEWG